MPVRRDPARVPVNVTLGKEELEFMRMLAMKEHSSVSALFRQMVRQKMAAWERKQKRTIDS